MTIIFEAAAAFVLVIMALWLVRLIDSRKHMDNHYWNHVCAYRVGLIKKRAAEREIELCFPDPEDKVVEKMEATVKEDLERGN